MSLTLNSEFMGDFKFKRAVARRYPDDAADLCGGIAMHDYIIVGKTSHASLKELKLI